MKNKFSRLLSTLLATFIMVTSMNTGTISVFAEENNEESGSETDDDSPNFRDKDKELKESIKSQLSPESQNVINMNDDEFNTIIEQLKKRGLSNDKGIELQKIRNITHGRNGINR